MAASGFQTSIDLVLVLIVIYLTLNIFERYIIEVAGISPYQDVMKATS